MNTLTLLDAITTALAWELAHDPNVVLFGEDIGKNGGVFRATLGLQERFGEDRVLDTPLAETQIAGMAIGMAAQGLRPVCEIQFAGFMYSTFDHLINHAARLRHRTRGRLSCPMVLRTPVGGGIHAPEHHGESPEAWLAHTPGLKVVSPSSPARARGLLTALTDGRTPRLAPPAGIAVERIAQEQRLLDGQYAEYQARIARIDAEIARREAEYRSTGEVVRKLEQTVPIARKRAEDYKGLVDKNFISKHGYLEKEQIRIEQEADLQTQRSRLKELAAAIDEAKGQRNSAVAETRRLALDTLNEAEQKATSFGQELVKADTRGKLMTLTAPVDGTVQQLAVRTVGGVVTEAQVLMVIVPQDDALEVEAFLENKDIGFVNAGQAAEVKVETFPFTRYGTIPASLVHVSRDAINDEKRGPIYSARARLQRATMQVEDKTVNLSAGMAVSLEVKTGKRRVIEYFLSPLLQRGSESLRER